MIIRLNKDLYKLLTITAKKVEKTFHDNVSKKTDVKISLANRRLKQNHMC